MALKESVSEKSMGTQNIREIQYVHRVQGKYDKRQARNSTEESSNLGILILASTVGMESAEVQNSQV
jgi:hypothetical protein